MSIFDQPPFGRVIYSPDYQSSRPHAVHWSLLTVDTTSVSIAACLECGHWKSTDGTVKCNCGDPKPPTPLDSDDFLWTDGD